jgi:hypothetical protein
MPDMTSRRWRGLVAAALALAAFISVVAAQRKHGIARDEVTYMAHGVKYARWWIDLVTFEDGTASERRITDSFGGARATDNNREHPPLMKTLFGLSRILFHDRLGWASEVTASRLPTALFHAAAVALIFLFAARLGGREGDPDAPCSGWGAPAGLFAALLFLFLPRAFFHAGLATFDAPMVTLWLATLLAYHASLRSRWWSLGLAIAFGLALATKHNALMLPGVILPHHAWLAWRRSRDGSVRGRERLRRFGRALVRTQPFLLPALFIGGPLVLVAVWPWLWFDTLDHVRDWIAFHTHHVHYNFEYLGRNYNHPPFPWHVVLVTTLFTVPVSTLAAAAVGAVHLAGRARAGAAAEPDRAPVLLFALSAAVAMGVFLIPTTPIFGAEKHWATALPTFCILAGAGIASAGERACRCLVARGWIPHAGGFASSATVLALGCLVATAALSETVVAQPYALSHYNALAGGAPGGADLGMNRQFWGYSARGVLPVLNARAPAPGQPPVPVYTHDASPAWSLYRRTGLLAPGLPDAGHETQGISRSRIALVIHERHFIRHDILIWREYGTVQPAYVLTFQGVPLVSVYVRPEKSGNDVRH